MKEFINGDFGRSEPSVVAVGLISYGAYLWHQPVFALVQHRFGSVAFSTYALPLIAMSFALAWASYVLVEQPFRKRLSVRTLTWSVLASAAVSIGGAVVMYVAADRNPHRVPSYKWAVAHADTDLLRHVERREVFMQCGDGADELGLQQCAFGDLHAPRTLVLWGDSLAQALLSGMDETAREEGVGGVAFIANGCPPVPGLQNTGLRECRGETHDAVLERIGDLPDLRDVVITGNLADAISAGNVRIDGGPTSYGAVREKLASALAHLKSIGVHVVMLEQGPTFPEDVSSYLIQNLRHGHLEPPEIDRAEHLDSLREVRRLADLVDRYVETTDIFCTEVVCPAVDARGQLVIFDRNHVTRQYAAILSRHLFQRADFQSTPSRPK